MSTGPKETHSVVSPTTYKDIATGEWFMDNQDEVYVKLDNGTARWIGQYVEGIKPSSFHDDKVVRRVVGVHYTVKA
ncbi:hypothetical protein [Burkholderia phage vB_BpP_HN03]|uniref:Uncharacterized protein n=1 Tax=Burkholderia phage vB_BpP_HN02 TaxID=3116925 RepID=A0AAX4JHR0_9CAUD|nr:hypothetical protein [Burkholderia phage vB_BpP_HN01]